MAHITKKHDWIKHFQNEIDMDELYNLEDHISEGDPTEVDESKIDIGDVSNNFDRIIIVDNTPQVPRTIEKKLKGMLFQIFSPYGNLVASTLSNDDDGIYIPYDETEEDAEKQRTLGYVFIQYSSPQAARRAANEKNNFRLDNKHMFAVNVFSDFMKFENWPEEYVKPNPTPIDESSLNAIDDKYAWLLDNTSRNQFSLRHGRETEIFWCEGPSLKADSVLAWDGNIEKTSGKVWTEMGTQWSPQGTYFVTYHAQGICTWVGSTFAREHRLSHPNVVDVAFSNDETHLITWNGNTDQSDKRALILWDLPSSKELRAFSFADLEESEVIVEDFPFKFSPDGKHFARLIRNGISLYSTETAKLVGKPIKAKGIKDFKWSPTDNVIAYWAPEHEPQPAAVSVLDPLTRKTLKSKNLFSVKSVVLHWHNDGDFLCAEVTRTKKKSKHTFAVLEIFRMRDNNIPVETVEMKVNSLHFSWEPKGVRFCVVLRNSITNVLSQAFYTAGKVKGGRNVELLLQMEKSFKQTSWSPAGTNLILHNFAKGEPSIQFWNLDELRAIQEGEHFTARDIRWDPSGRLVATVAHQDIFGDTDARNKLENGYKLWTFQGKLLQQRQLDNLYQFRWRPWTEKISGEALMSETEALNIKRNLNQYFAKFDEEDNMKLKRLELAQSAEKLNMLTDYRLLMSKYSEAETEVEQQRIAEDIIPDPMEVEYSTIAYSEEEFIDTRTELI